MIVFKYGDILTTELRVICQQVNCKGVMGKGLAKQIRDKYPEVYNQYKKFVDVHITQGDKLLGMIQGCTTNDNTHAIANLFAQENYGNNGNYTDLSALKEALEELVYLGNLSLKEDNEPINYAIPYNIGCGLGGADPELVHEILNEVFKDYEGTVEFWIYEPSH